MSSLEPTAKKSILIVDDEADVRSILKALLGRYGHVITEANDGQEALRLLSNQNYDLMILDLLMPGISGHEVLIDLKRQERLMQMPVILLTAMVSKNAKKACEAGATICMLKPFDNSTIQMLVNHLLDDKLTEKRKEQFILKLAKQTPGLLCHSSVTAK